MFRFNRNKWPDDDEYKRARHAYEGQGAAATRAARWLGASLIAMTGFAGLQTYDKHLLASLGDLKFAVIETSRTTGEVVSVQITDGKLMVNETMRRQFIRYWIKLWRAVPADGGAYNDNYTTAQVYMSDTVYNRIAEHMKEFPIDKFLSAGQARMVNVDNVTPVGGGTRYRVDWTEYTFRNSRKIATVVMTADLDLEQYQPKTEDEAKFNVFGLIIKGFYWMPPPAATG